MSLLVLVGVAGPVAARDAGSLEAPQVVVALLGGIVWTGMIGRWPSGRNLVYGLFFLGADILAVVVPALVATANDPTLDWGDDLTVGDNMQIFGLIALCLYGLVAMAALWVSVIARRKARMAATPAVWSRRRSVGWVSVWAVLVAVMAATFRDGHYSSIARWSILLMVMLAGLVGIRTGARASHLGGSATVLGMTLLGVLIGTIVAVPTGLRGSPGTIGLLVMLLALVFGLASFVIAMTASLVGLVTMAVRALRPPAAVETSV
jgi:hypothetical protein